MFLPPPMGASSSPVTPPPMGASSSPVTYPPLFHQAPLNIHQYPVLLLGRERL